MAYTVFANPLAIRDEMGASPAENIAMATPAKMPAVATHPTAQANSEDKSAKKAGRVAALALSAIGLAALISISGLLLTNAEKNPQAEVSQPTHSQEEVTGETQNNGQPNSSLEELNDDQQKPEEREEISHQSEAGTPSKRQASTDRNAERATGPASIEDTHEEIQRIPRDQQEDIASQLQGDTPKSVEPLPSVFEREPPLPVIKRLRENQPVYVREHGLYLSISFGFPLERPVLTLIVTTDTGDTVRKPIFNPGIAIDIPTRTPTHRATVSTIDWSAHEAEVHLSALPAKEKFE